jgi:hypothetical protein
MGWGYPSTKDLGDVANWADRPCKLLIKLDVDENSTRSYSPHEELCHRYDVKNRRIYMMSRDVRWPAGSTGTGRKVASRSCSTNHQRERQLWGMSVGPCRGGCASACPLGQETFAGAIPITEMRIAGLPISKRPSTAYVSKLRGNPHPSDRRSDPIASSGPSSASSERHVR